MRATSATTTEGGTRVPRVRIDWSRDEIILACELVRQNNWRALDDDDPRIVDLSRLLNMSPQHPAALRDPKFRNSNGVARKTSNIATRHPEYTGKPTRGNHLDGEVIAEFLANPAGMSRIAAEIRSTIERDDVDARAVGLAYAFEDEAPEGQILMARHIRRERSARLRNRKIDSVRAEGGCIACEVCSFDFAITYGDRGRGYIEVHHTLPLHASGEVRTRLQDLALLCSNCHRMIHRGRPWLTPDELRALARARTF